MEAKVIYALLRADGSINVTKSLIFGIGLNEAILFSELLSRHNYFESRCLLQRDGSFFNTIDDLYLGTGLGEKAQRTAIKNLEKLGLISVKVKSVPPRRFFRITQDISVISKYLKLGAERMKELEEKSQNPHEQRIPS